MTAQLTEFSYQMVKVLHLDHLLWCLLVLFGDPEPIRCQLTKSWANDQGWQKPGFKKKKPAQWVFLGFIGFYWVLLGYFGFYWVFKIFVLLNPFLCLYLFFLITY
jgi:hypothetical protein